MLHEYPGAPPLYLPLTAPTGVSVPLHRAYNHFVLKQARGLARWRFYLRLASWPIRATSIILRLTRRHGGFVAASSGRGRIRQIWDQLRLVFGSCIPPEAYLKFRLFDEEQREVAAEYLHRYETKNFLFRELNRRADKNLVNDKLRFSEFCRAHDLKTAVVLRRIPGGADAQRLPARDLLSKPQRGKGGRAITRWRFHDGRYRDCDTDRDFSHDELLHHLERSLEPTLLQIAESNHPDIEDLGHGVLTTVRVLACTRVDGEVEACCAVFRVPTTSGSIDNFHAGGIAAPVDMQTGTLGAAIALRNRSPRYTHHPDRPEVRIAGRVLPCFAEAIELVRRAQAAMSGYVVVGWDVGLTADGPCLIEANSGPCVDTMQRPLGRPLGATRFGELLREHMATMDWGANCK